MQTNCENGSLAFEQMASLPIVIIFVDISYSSTSLIVGTWISKTFPRG